MYLHYIRHSTLLYSSCKYIKPIKQLPNAESSHLNISYCELDRKYYVMVKYKDTSM